MEAVLVIKDKKIYQKVIEYINKEVSEGRLGKGDKLPPERKLVEILCVGRNSIREALKVLDIMGLVDRKQGDGTYIKTEFENWFSETLSIGFMLSDTSKKEIYEFRNMIEVEIATLAAERITQEEINLLKECYTKLIDHNNENYAVKYDREFHYIIAKASKNPIIINSYNAMSNMMDLFIYDLREDAFEDGGIGLVNQVHVDVFEAISNKQPEKAREAMKAHMDILKKYYK
jgi:GntR family transcriptional repressor for pyruvate dehydrogenase complex